MTVVPTATLVGFCEIIVCDLVENGQVDSKPQDTDLFFHASKKTNLQRALQLLGLALKNQKKHCEVLLTCLLSCIACTVEEAKRPAPFRNARGATGCLLIRRKSMAQHGTTRRECRV